VISKKCDEEYDNDVSRGAVLVFKGVRVCTAGAPG
jgi:hypothetical protein